MPTGKLNIFVVIILLLLGASAQAADGGNTLPPEAPWGAGVHDLKRLHPYMLRCYAGLDARMRSRIQRFRTIENYFGIRTETFYDFIGHRLYQVEYNFQQPNDLTFKLASSALVRRYGPPVSSSVSSLPGGELFEERSISDMAWKQRGLEVSLRQIFSRFSNGLVVRQLFITMRSADVLHSDRRPLQMQSDAEIDRTGALLRLAFAGGIDPQRLKSGATLDSVRILLDNADLAVATLEGALAVPHGSSADGPLFAVDDLSAASLKAAGLDVVNMAAGAALTAGSDAALVGADALHRAGIKTLGFGVKTDANTLVIEIKGVKLALLSFYYGGEDKKCTVPVNSGTGPAPHFSASCLQAMKFRYDVAARVAAAAQQADITVVLFSWRAADTGCSSQGQNMLVEAAWNAGATVVVGHAPGRLQPLRGAPGRVALISCGDLLSASGAGLVFTAELNRAGLVSYDFSPLSADNNGSPHKVDEKEARRIMDELHALEMRCNSENAGSK